MYCNRCGSQVSEDDRFCPMCGSNLYEEQKMGSNSSELDYMQQEEPRREYRKPGFSKQKNTGSSKQKHSGAEYHKSGSSKKRDYDLEEDSEGILESPVLLYGLLTVAVLVLVAILGFGGFQIYKHVNKTPVNTEANVSDSESDISAASNKNNQSGSVSMQTTTPTATPIKTPTATPAATATPTATPVPTDTPTATPVPTDTPTPTPTQATVFYHVGENDYIIPTSNSVYLTEADIAGMTLQEINYAKNEIAARRGRKFVSQELQEYFGSKSWYHGTIEPSTFDQSGGGYNAYESYNADLLLKREQALGMYQLR